MAEVQEQSQQVVTMTINDLIYAQVKDLGKRMDRLENRMDKLNERIDKITERMDKQDDKIEKLADKIDELRNEIKSSSNHGQIANITTIGIALAVIYSILK